MNVVITGASRGIGKAIAEIFASKGYDLYLTSRSDSTLNRTAEEIQKKYPAINVRAKAFDLSLKERAQQFGGWCLQQEVPDILVNNAGMFEPGSTFIEPDGLLENQIATNLYSAYHVTRKLVPKMIESTRVDGRSRHIF